MWHGSGSQGATISLLKSVAYNMVTLVWIGYLRLEPQRVPRLETALPADTFGMVLASSGGPDPDSGFMLRVEQAVDRVLSRSDWPRPATNRSRIVGRKPSPEEGN